MSIYYGGVMVTMINRLARLLLHQRLILKIEMGVFATRSYKDRIPIAITTTELLHVLHASCSLYHGLMRKMVVQLSILKPYISQF